MAKKKKGPSIVGSEFNRDLPNPKEAARRTGEVVKKIDPKKEKDGPGRPKATHGLKRTSVMVDPDKIKWFRIKAAREETYIYELLDEALADYMRKHK